MASDPPTAVLGKRKLDNDDDADEGWQKVERKVKKSKGSAGRPSGPPQIFHSPAMRLQSHVKIRDFQQLILYILARDTAPQWVAVRNAPFIKQIVLLMVPGLELGMVTGRTQLDKLLEPAKINGASSAASARRDYSSPDEYYPVKLHKEHVQPVLQPIANIFPHVWPVKAPGDEHYTRVFDAMYEMLHSTFPKTAEEKDTKGPLTSAASLKYGEKKRTPITHFLSDYETLLENEYVIHPALAPDAATKQQIIQGRKDSHQWIEDGWVDTIVDSLEQAEVADRDAQAGSITVGRQVYSLDCEFVKVEGNKFAAARVSLLDWNDKVVFDELVKPDQPITDYLTEFSGMTKEKLDPVTLTLAQVQAKLITWLTPTSILMGHSLDSDLSVIKMTHPFIIDTSIQFPHPMGPPKKSALKWLTKKYLSRQIQSGGATGHDSIEDARAVLDLIKQKCERGPNWGAFGGNLEPIFKRIGREIRLGAAPDGQMAEEVHRRTGMVDWGSPERGVGANANRVIGCQSDADVVRGVKELSALGTISEPDRNGDTGTSDHIDLIWGRLRELEAVRGWWWRSTNPSTELDRLRSATLTRYGIKETDEKPHTTPELDTLKAAIMQTAQNISSIHGGLAPGTALIVFSGNGDKREVIRLQALQQQFNREYKTKKWDELSVRWTDNEAQALRGAVRKAREGVGFVVVKG